MENTKAFSSASTLERASYLQGRSTWGSISPSSLPSGSRVRKAGSTRTFDPNRELASLHSSLQLFSSLKDFSQKTYWRFKPFSPLVKPATRFGPGYPCVAWHTCDTSYLSLAAAKTLLGHYPGNSGPGVQ